MLHEGHSLGEPQRLFEEIDIDMVRKRGTGHKAAGVVPLAVNMLCSLHVRRRPSGAPSTVARSPTSYCPPKFSFFPRTANVRWTVGKSWVHLDVAYPPWLTQLFSTTACAATEADFKRLEKLVEEQRQLVRVKVEGRASETETMNVFQFCVRAAYGHFFPSRSRT